MFEHGTIFWWPDTGAIDMGDVVVRCIGLHAFGEMDWDQLSGDDEIYALFSVLSPLGAAAMTTAVAGGVDGGETHGYDVELYRGAPSGLLVTSTLMEEDFGGPENYLGDLQDGVDAVMEAGEKALYAIPYFGAVLGVAHDKLVTESVKRQIAAGIAKTLDLGDDALGIQSASIGQKRMVTTAARSPLMRNWGWSYDFESDLFSAHGGSWKLLFAITRA